MRHVASVTMAAGTSSVALPDNFKQLQPQQGSVALYDAVDGYFPCEVLTRERILLARSSPQNGRFNVRVFLSNDGNQEFLNYLDNTTTAATFSIAYFRFLPPLVADSDENYLTREFEEMIQAKIKQIAFSTINDPQAGVELGLYEVEKRKAVAFDARQYVQGRNVRMGG